MSIDPEKLLHLAKRRHGPAGVTLGWPMVVKIVDELRRLQRENEALAARVERPTTCRNKLRDNGQPYPKSGCAACGNGGITGCPYEYRCQAEGGEACSPT